MSFDFAKKIGVVILAAGVGKRMKSTKLKVMHEVKGRPMIDFVVAAVEQAALGRRPTVIVCDNDPAVQNYVGERAEYAVQAERLGTGHAVSIAESKLRGQVEQVVALSGDMPFVSSDSIKRLVERHLERGNTVTLMTVTVPDFAEWRSAFSSFGKIVRGVNGHIAKIVEKKDATSTELDILELNPAVYCFKSDWLWDNLKKIKNNNAQQEYYLTDLIQLAIEQGEKISSISIESREAVGINSPEDLESAENLV